MFQTELRVFRVTNRPHSSHVKSNQLKIISGEVPCRKMDVSQEYLMQYSFAQRVLCVANGCAVGLVTNWNIV